MIDLDKKILILGASGQVGRNLKSVLGMHRNIIYTARNPQDTSIFRLDFTNLNFLNQFIHDHQPQTIINCAAHTAVDQAEKEPELALEINGKAVGVIAKAANELGSFLIHYSTDYVFDGHGERPWTESDSPNPINEYGRTKLFGEREIQTIHPYKSYIFRTQWVYDNHGKNFLNTMFRLGVERESLAVVHDQIGSPTSAEVIAEYTLKSLNKIFAGEMASGIYNLTCRGETSWYNFASEIFKIAKQVGYPIQLKTIKPISSFEFPTPAERPKNSRLSLTKIESSIGESLPEWKDALKKVIDARANI